MFRAARLATILFTSGPARDASKSHLFILLTDPLGPAKQVLMIPICTVGTNPCDSACMINQGEHPFIRHESYVAYSLARIEPASKLENGVKNGQFFDKGQASEELFKKVVAGLVASRYSKPFATAFFKDYLASKGSRGH